MPNQGSSKGKSSSSPRRHAVQQQSSQHQPKANSASNRLGTQGSVQHLQRSAASQSSALIHSDPVFLELQSRIGYQAAVSYMHALTQGAQTSSVVYAVDAKAQGSDTSAIEGVQAKFTTGQSGSKYEKESQRSTIQSTGLVAGQNADNSQDNKTQEPDQVAFEKTITQEMASALSDKDLEVLELQLRVRINSLKPTAIEYPTQLQNQKVIQEEKVARTLNSGNTPGSKISAHKRFRRFKNAVLLAAQNRLTQNQQTLDHWRFVITQQLSALELQIHALAQKATEVEQDAMATQGTRAFDAWSSERNPYMRRVYEKQAENLWRACTGCHVSVQARNFATKTPQTGPAWQAPAKRLSTLSGTENWDGDRLSSSAAVTNAAKHIQSILGPLGDRGFQIIPDDVFSTGSFDSPEQLRNTMLGYIDKRQQDYGELRNRIIAGDVDYLQLAPVLQDLLPKADTDVRTLVEIDRLNRKIEQYAYIGATLILTLLPILFPPAGLVLAPLVVAHGYNTYQQGQNLTLGTGANNVFMPEQQKAGPTLKMAGATEMAMGTLLAYQSARPIIHAIDDIATANITHTDISIAQKLAQRALKGPIPEAELLQLQQKGLVTRVANRWANARGFQIFYRGQTSKTGEILSPIAREKGVASSQKLYDDLRKAGLVDADIAGYTARYNFDSVPPYNAPAGFANQPLGGAGIPASRLPNIAADFAKGPEGVIYVLRIPKKLGVEIGKGGWGSQSLLEQEWVFFHQIPNGMVVRVMSPKQFAPLRYEYNKGHTLEYSH